MVRRTRHPTTNTRLSILFILSLFTVASVRAQGVSGNLEGRVLDTGSHPLQSATVGVKGPSLQGVRGTSTDEAGNFRLLALPAGFYTVEVRLISFRSLLLQNVRIRLGQTTTIGEVRLEPESVELEGVIVSAERPLIDPASTAIGGTLVTEEFRSLPLQRNYLSIPTLLPQANESAFGEGANFSGATGLENRYLIDGSEVTDPYLGVRGLGIPYNFIKDIEVSSGGYAAEYKSTLGGIVNATTYAGGNEIQGQAFGFFTSNGLSANPYTPAEARTTRGFSSYDVGLGIGGPILQDRLWFHGAYNPSFFRQDVLIPGLNYTPENQTTHGFAGKITWKAADNTTIVGSVVGDPTTKRTANLTSTYIGTVTQVSNEDAVLQDWNTGTVNASLSGVIIPNNSVLLEASVSYLRWWQSAQPINESARSALQVVDVEHGIIGGGIGLYWAPRITQLTAETKGTLMLGPHTLKGGLEYRERSLNDSYTENQLIRSGDTSFMKVDITSDGTTRGRFPSAFLQDTWQVTNRLSVNGGIRWDGQFIIASDGHVHQKILGEFQPRVGFVLQLSEPSTERFYGFYGRYYEELLHNIMSYYSDRLMQSYIKFNHDPRIDPTGGEVELGSSIPDAVPGLMGQYTDEYVLGYERQVLGRFKVGVRGVYRRLGEAIEDVYVPEKGYFVYGNPGDGILSFAPPATRKYTALVLSFEKPAGDNFAFSLSYTLSRNYGNYAGLFNPDNEQFNPNATTNFDYAESFPNSTGLLPDDITHMAKLWGSYQFSFGLSVGMSFLLQSGTPITELGGSSFLQAEHTFLQPRGSVGRTPPLWDLNLRLAYDLARVTGTMWRPRLIIDILHVASQRRPTALNEVHYFDIDANGNQVNPNPFYLTPTHYQQPMSMRVGMEVDF